MRSEFILTVCQVGAEKALKKEVLREHPEFRFAFSRPGFVTFKNSTGPLPLDFTLKSVFARAYGLSLGLFQPSSKEGAPSSAELPGLVVARAIELARELSGSVPSGVASLAAPTASALTTTTDRFKKIRLHIWERDFHFPGDEPLGFVRGLLLGDLEKQLRLAGETCFESDPIPALGDRVLQVIALDPGVWAIGAFAHSAAHSRWPGGRPQIQLPSDSPSRAFLKLEEALLWSGAPFKAGDIAVEIGSSPGGASLAMLKRGLTVVGIDPAVMDPRVLRYPTFTHLRKAVGQVLREELPASVQWLLLDMNVDPSISLFAVDRLVSRMPESLLGVILTVKLNDWKFANEIPYMIEHVQAMGMVRVRAAQLSYHRQELVIFGLTRRGLALK